MLPVVSTQAYTLPAASTRAYTLPVMSTQVLHATRAYTLPAVFTQAYTLPALCASSRVPGLAVFVAVSEMSEIRFMIRATCTYSCLLFFNFYSFIRRERVCFYCNLIALASRFQHWIAHAFGHCVIFFGQEGLNR